MKKRKEKKENHGRVFVVFSVLFLVISCALLAVWFYGRKEKEDDMEMIAEKLDLEEVKEHYHTFGSATDGAKLYRKDGETYVESAMLYGNIELELDSTYVIVDEYFKLLNSDYYVQYKDVNKIDSLSSFIGEYKYYKNYIPYNENVVVKESAKLYVDEDSYYEISGGSFPIIVKDGDRYGVEYNNQLVYVGSSDVENVVESNNTTLGHTDGIGVLNYHYVVNKEAGELNECVQDICITDTMFDDHMKYLKENGYYSVSMRDLELFIEGKIQLPEKSVSITIDDGWYVSKAIPILEKYQMLATLFLIGSLASPNDYRSSYLEVHSHTWDMHKLGDCPASVGRGGILCLDENTILEDLKKSRESLNNTTYFCYPFYDYNERAIALLKQAGFTMAFAGELKDSTVHVGQNKFKIPRYVIVNYTTMNDFIRYVS